MKFIFLIFFFFISLSIQAQDRINTLWTSLLNQHVVKQEVDYVSLKLNPVFSVLKEKYQNYDIRSLETNEEKLAFWINAYNVAAVNLVCRNYPVKSIKDIGTLLSPVWKLPALVINDTYYSLNEIEHQILRRLNDSRIHFAIVCASRSCPDLRKEAYRPEMLSYQLDDQVRLFLSDPTKGMFLDEKVNVVKLSRIFRWFKKDFDSMGGVDAFVQLYTNKNITSYHHKWLRYDWSLNERKQ